MAQVTLTKGGIAIVDDCFLESILGIGHWQLKHAKQSNVQYAFARVPGSQVSMHRLVWVLAGNSDDAETIDHRSFHTRYGKWEARIKVHRKRYYLGRFDNPIDAAKAYDAAARELHGEFAWLNFPNQ